MNVTLGCVIVAIIAMSTAGEAASYGRHIEHQRSRRGAVIGAVGTNPKGGADVHVEAFKQLGPAVGSVSATGNTAGGPVTTGGKLAVGMNGVGAAISKSHTPGVSDTLSKSAHVVVPLNERNNIAGSVYGSKTNLANGFRFEQKGGALEWANANGHGASISRDRIPGFSDTLTKNAHANLFASNRNSIDASVFDKRTQFANGFALKQNGGNLAWSNVDGHGANLGLTNTHGIGKQLSLGANTNLFTSADQNTRIDGNAGASRWLSGPFKNTNDFGFGLSVSHRFGG